MNFRFTEKLSRKYRVPIYSPPAHSLPLILKSIFYIRGHSLGCAILWQTNGECLYPSLQYHTHCSENRMFPLFIHWSVPYLSNHWQLVIFFFLTCLHVLCFPECSETGIIKYVAFSDWLLFTFEYASKVPLVSSGLTTLFFFFKCWMNIHCVDVPQFVYSFTCWRTSLLLPSLGLYE